MSENLMESVVSQLTPPVTREPVLTSRKSDGGTDVAIPHFPMHPMFADDDAE